MPTKMGRPTRKEKSKVNKAAHSAAMRDVLADSSRIPLDPYRKEEHLPSELIDGNALRRRRGTRTDEDCVNHVCELVACGMTCKAARDHVGVPAITWYYWRRDNVARILEKYELAKMVRLELMSDEIMDIADASIASERTEGNVEAKDADLLKKREHRIKARQWFLERLAHQYAPKQQVTSISQTLNVTMTPEDAMREYIKIIDEKPA